MKKEEKMTPKELDDKTLEPAEKTDYEEKEIETLSDNLEMFSKDGLSRCAEEPIKTGFKNVDEMLGGGIYKGLTVLGAESGLGKSTLVFQIAEQITKKYMNQPVLIFSMEMSAFQINAKAISRGIFQIVAPEVPDSDFDIKKAEKLGAIESKSIMNKEEIDSFDDATWKRIIVVRDNLKACTRNIHIYKRLLGDARPDCDIIAEKVTAFIENHPKMKKPLVIIDYLQILSAGDAPLNDKQIIDKNVKAFSSMARSMPVIVISSMNRNSYQKSNKGMSDFSGSSGIEYSADTLLTLEFRNTSSKTDIRKIKSEFPRKVKLVPQKQRTGDINKTASFNYYAAYDCFVEDGEVIKSVDVKNSGERISNREKADKSRNSHHSDRKKWFRELPEVKAYV